MLSSVGILQRSLGILAVFGASGFQALRVPSPATTNRPILEVDVPMLNRWKLQGPCFRCVSNVAILMAQAVASPPWRSHRTMCRGSGTFTICCDTHCNASP